jgi:4-amino-4-deoxychorismate lyase
MTRIEDHIVLDNGYFFGMGVFETIAVEKGKPLFLPWHLERMEKGLDTLGISKKMFLEKATSEAIAQYLNTHPMQHGALKIMASEQNLIFTTRENPYTDKDYKKGLRLDISPVLRNETSPFTYVKSFHYGDNLLEKKRAKQQNYDETLFLNTKGQITETSASNIFFVKNKQLYTPLVKCGLLDGILRRYLIETYKVQEVVLTPIDFPNFDEAFLTNSLMGIMPVLSIGKHSFSTREYTDDLLNVWKKYCLKYPVE